MFFQRKTWLNIIPLWTWISYSNMVEYTKHFTLHKHKKIIISESEGIYVLFVGINDHVYWHKVRVIFIFHSWNAEAGQVLVVLAVLSKMHAKRCYSGCHVRLGKTVYKYLRNYLKSLSLQSWVKDSPTLAQSFLFSSSLIHKTSHPPVNAYVFSEFLYFMDCLLCERNHP